MDDQKIQNNLIDQKNDWSRFFHGLCEGTGEKQVGITTETFTGKKIGLHWNEDTKDLYIAINDERIENPNDELWKVVLALADKVKGEE